MSRSGAAASRPIRCGVTKRSIAIAVSDRASAAVTPTRPPSVCTSMSVMKYELCTFPRPHAGRKSAGSGTSSTREVTAVIVVGLVKLQTIMQAFDSAD